MIGSTYVNYVDAQCPMCRISAESNLKNGGTEGRGLNAGILFILSLPYVLVGGLGYIWYRNRIKNHAEDNIEPPGPIDTLSTTAPINN